MKEILNHKTDLKKYYAAFIVQGILAGGRHDPGRTADRTITEESAKKLAEDVFVIADAMVGKAIYQ